ncbi:MAG: hypothetical protein RMJ56_09115 [Gemmataceae bacterium]|nr:hypothetical protein [Gemmata sp.]MDW8197747.1 hypothetical protein [Gemmataceae bacterium]
MATAPSPHDLTRQQLDELDALLQRMLSLPLTPAESSSPPASSAFAAPPLPPGVTAQGRIDTAVNPPAPQLSLLEAPSSGSIKIEEPPPLPPLTPPPAPVKKPVAAPTPAAPVSPATLPASQANASASAEALPVSSASVTPRPSVPENSLTPSGRGALHSATSAESGQAAQTLDSARPTRPITPPPMAPPIPVIFWPLLGITALFDAFCGLLGRPGRWLRSPFFKHLYGAAGLGLLLYTGAYMAQVNGWLTLPVQLPWPK